MRFEVQLYATRVEPTPRYRKGGGRKAGYPNSAWTPELDRLLSEAWRAGGPAHARSVIRELQPGWSRFIVQRRARKLGLAPSARPWSSEEVNLLLHAVGGSSSVRVLAVMLRRTEAAVRSKLRQLKYTLDDFDGYRAKDLAEWLNVSVRQVRYWVERG